MLTANTNTSARISATLLFISALLLSSMIPGGPVESRDFSHYSPFILAAFNTFLTLLGLASFIIPLLLLRQWRHSGLAATLCGGSYFLVYALDLLQIFPLSVTPMPDLLRWLETLGLILSVPLTIIAAGTLHTTETSAADAVSPPRLSRQRLLIMAALLPAAAAIIVFATLAAMGR